MSDLDFELSSLDRETHFAHSTPVEWDALFRLTKAAGDVAVKSLLRNGDASAQRAAAQEFIVRELADARAKARMTPASASASRHQPIKFEISKYDGNEATPLRRWFVELDEAICARQITDGRLQVSFAMSQLSGRARTWAFGRLLADNQCFPDLSTLKSLLQQTYEPPQHEFRLRAEFLTVKQGNMDLHDYIQKVRYLASCVVGSPIDTATQVTQFMMGLHEGPVKTQLYREYPETLELAFACALREDFNARQARGPTRTHARAAPDEPEPMDLSVAQVQRAPVHTQASRSRDDRTCFRCQKRGHVARDCRAPAPVAGAPRSSTDSGRTSDEPKNGRDR